MGGWVIKEYKQYHYRYKPTLIPILIYKYVYGIYDPLAIYSEENALLADLSGWKTVLFTLSVLHIIWILFSKVKRAIDSLIQIPQNFQRIIFYSQYNYSASIK
jgi:hypothetical protein